MLDEWSHIHKLVETVISVMDARDPYTYEHSERVALISELIARKLNLDKKWINLIHIAAHLHDIGKIGVPDYILNKKGSLTNTEFDIMKSHSRIGYNIVKNIDQLKETSTYILHHHERWDGKGYPFGYSKKTIPLGARIIAIADTFDAMTSKRTYKDELSIDDAILEIKNVKGTQLCPECVDAFISMEKELPFILNSANKSIKHNAFLDEEKTLFIRSKIIK